MKLSKTYQTKKDAYGFTNDIDITLDYDPETHTIENVEVNCYSLRKGISICLTDIFESSPFAQIVDNLDWHQIYLQQVKEKAEREALYAELDSDGPIIYKEGFGPTGSLFEQACNIVRDQNKAMYGI